MIIRSARIVSPTAEIFSFAQQGHIDGLKALFSDGLASPFDVCAGSGRSALNVSLLSDIDQTSATDVVHSLQLLRSNLILACSY
jgi:hypothetical protein